MYVDIGWVSGNRQTSASPAVSGSGVAALEEATQPAGVVTVKVYGALRSGCAKVV